MSAVSRNVDTDDLLAELRRQDWRLEQTSDGRSYRCFPPAADRAMVTVSLGALRGGGNPHAVVQVLRHLRHQGFIWPPPERKKVEPVVRAVPFEPKPSPVVSTEPVTQSRKVETSSELAFVELKEAKGFVDLAAIELRASQAEVERAQKRLESATTVYKEALTELRAKKSAFDAQFAAEEVP